MCQFDLNDIPKLLESKEFTVKEAVNYLAVFISQNIALFGLQKKSEDFISDVILIFLERGPNIIKRYSPSLSSFFTYFYLCVKSISSSHSRKISQQSLKEYHTVSESINEYSDTAESYEAIKYREFNQGKVPYNYKPVSYQALQIACKADDINIKNYWDSNLTSEYQELLQKLSKIPPSLAQKILIILGLKSSYYISDNEIDLICKVCNINKEYFLEVVMEIKKTMHNREENKTKLEERRNKAYYHHRKYKNLLEFDSEMEELQKLEIKNKYEKQTHNWENINRQLEKGKVLIRPTTKLISEILDISERQIHYYQKTARLLGLDDEEV